MPTSLRTKRFNRERSRHRGGEFKYQEWLNLGGRQAIQDRPRTSPSLISLFLCFNLGESGDPSGGLSGAGAARRFWLFQSRFRSIFWFYFHQHLSIWAAWVTLDAVIPLVCPELEGLWPGNWCCGYLRFSPSSPSSPWLLIRYALGLQVSSLQDFWAPRGTLFFSREGFNSRWWHKNWTCDFYYICTSGHLYSSVLIRRSRKPYRGACKATRRDLWKKIGNWTARRVFIRSRENRGLIRFWCIKNFSKTVCNK